MLAKVYIREYAYNIRGIGILSMDNNFITYVPIEEAKAQIKVFTVKDYLNLYSSRMGWVYSDKNFVDAVIYDKSKGRYIYLPKYRCSSTFNVKEPTEELVKQYVEGYKCL